MTKSSEQILFGVRGYEEKRGLLPPEAWARMRTGASPNKADYGTMPTPEGIVMWFNDPITRDEFEVLYGGLKVTLSRKIEVHVGKKAAELARAMQQ